MVAGHKAESRCTGETSSPFVTLIYASILQSFIVKKHCAGLYVHAAPHIYAQERYEHISALPAKCKQTKFIGIFNYDVY
jgi:hypothetical protein